MDVESLTGLTFYEKLGFVYLSGMNGEGQEIVFAETADEVELSDPEVFYTTNLVNIRSEASADSEVAGTAALASEVEVIGGSPIWFHIRQGEVEGYINQRFLTADQNVAAAAQTAEDNARAAAEAAAQAAAAAAAAQAAQAAASSSSGSGSSGSDNACLDGGVLF